MADTKISALTAVTTPLGAQEFAVNDAGTTKKITLSQINGYTDPTRQVVTATQALSATETYVTSSGIILPQANMQAGTVYRAWIVLTKSAASTVAGVVNVKLGVNGTTADTTLTAFTLPAVQTAVIDTAWFEFFCTFRAFTTTSTIYSSYSMHHKLAATGFMTQASAADGGVSASVNPTTANTRIGISMTGGTSSAWTVQAGEFVLENLVD